MKTATISEHPKAIGTMSQAAQRASDNALNHDPDQRPDGRRVDGMTPHRAAIVAAWARR